MGRPTLRQALGVLQAEGLLDKRHGIGNVVRAPHQRIGYTSTPGLVPTPPASVETEVKVREVPARRSLARLLKVPQGTPLVETVFVSQQRGSTPHSITTTYTPAALLPRDGRHPEPEPCPWGTDTRTRLSAAGTRLALSVERVTARPPTSAEAETLRIALGVPVLSIERATTDTTGRVVEIAYLTLSGDRTEALYTTTH
ncbi:GntR family transcriptional regulator [Streptomyces hoynatensis]|uniref:GntR family transcriptional regulator n=1 Tax=Streptomyces hoynatensis TaxID=1141874 RepID=UPI00131A06D1|nr:GntR family transcriptional regulator [Streptomyces hoynatensis]